MKLLSQNHIKYALIMCGVVAVCLLLMELTGQNDSFEKSPYAVFFTMIAPIVVWFMGIREKKKLLHGKLPYKKGVLEGFKIGLAFGITSPFVFLLYYAFVNPQILPSVKMVYQMNNASDAMIIGVDMLVQFFAATLFGTIYGAIISLFLKTKS